MGTATDPSRRQRHWLAHSNASNDAQIRQMRLVIVTNWRNLDRDQSARSHVPVPMKKLLPVLLIGTSLALCVMLAVQWVQAARQWETIETQDRTIFDKDKLLQSFTNQVNIMSAHLTELEKSVGRLEGDLKTNKQELVKFQTELNKSEVLRTNLTLQLEQYQNAFEVATNRLALAYENIKQQNEAIKDAIAQRDSFVAQLNVSIKERNEIVKQHNELVEQWKEQQELTALVVQAGPRQAEAVRQYQELLAQAKKQRQPAAGGEK